MRKEIAPGTQQLFEDGKQGTETPKQQVLEEHRGKKNEKNTIFATKGKGVLRGKYAAIKDAVLSLLRHRGRDRQHDNPPGEESAKPKVNDVFISYRHKDAAPVRALANSLHEAGLQVWIDDPRIEELTSIQEGIDTGLSRSKALLAWYSEAYPESRPCQWEFNAAFLTALPAGQARERILIVNPAGKPEHIQPELYRDQKYLIPVGENVTGLVKAIKPRVDALSGSFEELGRKDNLAIKPSWYGRHPSSAEYFTGRLRDLWEIHGALHADQYPVIHNRTAVLMAQVTGLGGMGKSLLAEEYGLRYASQYPGGIFFLNARDVIDDQLAGFAIQPAKIDIKGLKPPEVRRALGNYLEEKKQPYLWIVDDLPESLDEQGFQKFLPPENAFAHTLITTRSGEYQGRGEKIPLERLTPAEALSLLTRKVKPQGPEEEMAAKGICEDLGGHSLAIDVVSRALENFPSRPRFSQYREELNNPREDELEFASSLEGLLPNGHEKSIAATLMRSYTGLSEEAKTLLRLAVELDRAPIPVDLAVKVLSQLPKIPSPYTPHLLRVKVLGQLPEIPPENAKKALRKGLDDLTNSAFAQKDAEGEAYQPHVLVTRTVRFKDSLPERQKSLRDAAISTLRPILTKNIDIRQFSALKPYMPHARHLSEQPADEQEALLASRVARHDFERGEYGEARKLHERVLALRQQKLGPEHPNTIISMGNLAATLSAQGEFSEARKLDEQVLALQQQKLGPEHPSTLTSMNNLAATLSRQGELSEARKLEEQVLALRQQTLEKDHPDTLTSMNNLTITLFAQGEFSEARKLQEQVVALQQQVLGKEHPETLRSMHHLAHTLFAQGEFSEARKLQEQVVALQQQVLGKEHPNTLISMNNLAATLSAQGEFSEARKLVERVLALQQQKLGPEHPDTLTSMGNLAITLFKQKKLSEARKLQEQVVALQQQVLGKEHPSTLRSMNDLASTLSAQGEFSEARKLQEQVSRLRGAREEPPR